MSQYFGQHFGRKVLSAGAAAMALGFASGLCAQERGLGWGYNSYGLPGLIDMPSALGREDGELAFSVSHFKKQTRDTLAFQITRRLSGAFRYSILKDVSPRPGAAVVAERFDRSFSVHYRFLDEGRLRPAMAIGLNDIIGTGIYGGEYIVASKTFSPAWRASVGLGWGRLGSFGGFSNPLAVFGDRMKTRPNTSAKEGGTFQSDTWFRGDAAFFGGVEWRPDDRMRIVAEYSSDAYEREDGSAFTRRSPFNFGIDYRLGERSILSARYLYGSELGVQFTYALNPKHPRHGAGLDPAPPPVVVRPPEPREAPEVDESQQVARMRAALAQQGITLEGVERDGQTLRIQIRNMRYAVSSQALGRAARVLTAVAPAHVARFEIRLATHGMPVTSVVLRRADLEQLEFDVVAPDLMRARSRIADAPEALAPLPGRYPEFSYGLSPYLIPGLFDPEEPLRLDFGVSASFRFEPRAGLVLKGRINQKLLGNLDQDRHESDSVLPHVRSDAVEYFKGSDLSVPELTAAWFFRPGGNLFGRVSVGLLERMYGGVSGELLWKPENSRLALGAEMNAVRQRAFDDIFGFRDYSVTTGHVSAYYEFDGGYLGQLDVGRYLAGDVGATLTLAREFDNGWKVGAFATLTDVSAEDFGEGSFDKGIILMIPTDWITGRPVRSKVPFVLHSLQRDGGARLAVSDRLYDVVRDEQANRLNATWGRFWR